MSSGSSSHTRGSAEQAWQLMLLLAQARRDRRALRGDCTYSLDVAHTRLTERAPGGSSAQSDSPLITIARSSRLPVVPGAGWSEAAVALLTLYAPVVLAGSDRPYAIGHLGQSLDGCIATASGHSLYVTGEENLCHLHRLRALSDAVIVGGGTAAADDPRLTTRLVAGPNPVRVIVDPGGRLPASLGVFRDGAAPTLHAVAEGSHSALAEAHTIRLPEPREARLPVLVAALARRGLVTLFVEGGGVTVSEWVQAGLLDRLHLTIAPVLIGEGRRAMQLPSVETMDTARRPSTRRWRMGEDVLWDLDLRCLSADDRVSAEPPGTSERDAIGVCPSLAPID